MLERIPKIIWRPVLTHLCSVKEKEKQITGVEIFVIPRDIKVSFIYKMWAVRSSIWVDLHISYVPVFLCTTLGSIKTCVQKYYKVQSTKYKVHYYRMFKYYLVHKLEIFRGNIKYNY